MGNQRDSYIFQYIISATLVRRNQNQIGVHTHHRLIIEIPLDSDFDRLARLQPVIHLFVEQMARAGDSHHPVQRLQLDEV